MNKIIHVPPRYFPAISGSEFYLQRVSEILSKEYPVEVHCTNALDFKAFRNKGGKRVFDGEQHQILNNVDVYRHKIDYEKDVLQKEKEILRKPGKFNYFYQPNEILDNGPVSSSLRKALMKSKGNIIHATPYPYANLITALYVAREREIPCLLTPFIHEKNPRYNTKIIKLVSHFDKILACSQSEKLFLTNHSFAGNKIEKITMGVDVAKFDKATTVKFKRVTGVDPNHHKLILFCGYKNFEKGAITILHTIENVIKKHPNAMFIMIGPPTMQYNREFHNLGNLREYIVNINPASLSGYFDKTKLGAFKACDVFVMPSRSDAYGIAYLEAWASKKPVIASNIPAMRDLFEDGKEGFHVKFDDPQQLASKINLLLDDKELGFALGERGYNKIIEERLTWEDVARRILSIYQDIGFN